MFLSRVVHPPPGRDWFSRLFGFSEDVRWGYERIQGLFEVSGSRLRSRVNKASYRIGQFETPSLAELRSRVAGNASLQSRCRGRLRLSGVVEDVSVLQAIYPYATFQAASQFNCLEFVAPSVTPEDGVTGYVYDKTQGPACSVSCGPATVYRNYFVQVHDGQLGQRADRQLNNLEQLSDRLGNVPNGRYFLMQSGYTLADDAGLERLGAVLRAMGPRELDECRSLLRVGVHEDVQVTSSLWGRQPLDDDDHVVTQVFGSACSVANSRNPPALWRGLASLVLEASYEATLYAALENRERNYEQPNARLVFFTLLGGGVFGNDIDWIVAAIDRACLMFADYALDVRIVSYAETEPQVAALIAKYQK